MGDTAEHSRASQKRDARKNRRQPQRYALFACLASTADLAIELTLPPAALDKLTAMERHNRYNDPIQWGVDVFGELGMDKVRAYVEEEARKFQAQQPN